MFPPLAHNHAKDHKLGIQTNWTTERVRHRCTLPLTKNKKKKEHEVQNAKKKGLRDWLPIAVGMPRPALTSQLKIKVAVRGLDEHGDGPPVYFNKNPRVGSSPEKRSKSMVSLKVEKSV